MKIQRRCLRTAATGWLLLGLFGTPGRLVFGQTPGPSPADLDQMVSSALGTTGAPSASVAVVRNGELVYQKAFGKADIEKNRQATENTRYAVGSISKQFTVAALLLAEEQGKLSLDDKVSKFYPDLTRANEITIRELLSHTSGYEDYAPQDYMIPEWLKHIEADAILDRWAKKPLNFDPGTKWEYSNTNYVLAGKIFEKVSGQPLVPFLQEHIFRPLEMRSAGDCEEASPEDATAYTRYALGPPRPVAREAEGWYFAAGELCMTPSDLARWDIAFLAKRILSAKSYEEFTKEAMLKDGRPTHYALGLGVGDLHGTPMISHSGEVSGFLAINRVFPSKGVGVVVLTNEDGVNLIGPLSQDISLAMIEPSSSAKIDGEVRTILEGLQQGRIDRARFTSNANFYFNEAALNDYRNSLALLGKLQSVMRQNEQGRGGMTHLSYRAQFEKKSVVLNIFLTHDGKFEQFLVEEQL
ncbi:MAG: beta-lactamase family protein [Acidobacteriaceae bacterium]|nr:beta-lactamase family protein [Acidobacteriaceae bacterium]MBV9778622.1 beta-lactamase family protein [Acidobacteriaceae bacterium]